MQLGNKIYSRVEIELDNEASSVVGVENQAHLFVRIQLEKAVVPSALARTAPPQPPQEDLSSAEAGRPDVMAPVAITALRVLPLEPQPTEDSDGEPVGPLGPMGNDPAGVDSGVSDNADEGDTLSSDAGNELFFQLVPDAVRGPADALQRDPVRRRRGRRSRRRHPRWAVCPATVDRRELHPRQQLTSPKQRHLQQQRALGAGAPGSSAPRFCKRVQDFVRGPLPRFRALRPSRQIHQRSQRQRQTHDDAALIDHFRKPLRSRGVRKLRVRSGRRDRRQHRSLLSQSRRRHLRSRALRAPRW